MKKATVSSRSSSYLVRFDDICPTMNWHVWEQIEHLLLREKILPMLAVVPDNQDAKLKAAAPRDEFWEWLQDRKRDGWSVGWHGHQHLYTNEEAGIVGIHRGSEFAGLAPERQRIKLEAARAVFVSHGIIPDVWIAPGHSFDQNTVRILSDLGMRVISDGFFRRPIIDQAGSTWVPQQLWRFRMMPPGVWTVCYHINDWGPGQIEKFEKDIVRFRDSITDLTTVLRNGYSRPGLADYLFSWAWRRALLFKGSLARHA